MASEFQYFEDPFLSPITTVSELENVWKEVEAQEIEHLEIVSLYGNDIVGMAQYDFIAQIDGKRHESRGVYFVRLDQTGRATEFRQWYIE